MNDRTLTAAVEPDTTVTIMGWIHEVRDLGGIAFVLLRDRSGLIQVKIEKEELDDALTERALGMARESVIAVTGSAAEEPRAPTGVEIVPSSIEEVAGAEPNLPLDPSGKVDAELSTRLSNRTLDLRRPEVAAIFRIRACVLEAARRALREADCTEITTPKIVATGTEGGTELFPITYFGEEAFMNQSPQLFKQLIAGSSLERVFEIGPIFRAEEHNTPRHLNEATSIDFEGAFFDADSAMSLVEAVVVATYEAVADECQDALATLGIEGFEPPPSPSRGSPMRMRSTGSMRRGHSPMSSHGGMICPPRPSVHSVRPWVSTTSSPRGRRRSSRSTSWTPRMMRPSRRGSI
jgi:aspartyl-tRNA synthetase (EC 6.1.1.12)